MKKVLFTGDGVWLGANFSDTAGTAFDVTLSPRETDLTAFEAVQRLFAVEKYDAVVFTAIADKNETDALIAFKNVQYAALGSGVRQMLVLNSAADLGARPLENAREEEFDACIPQGAGVGHYLISRLAAKDPISTVLRVGEVYGKGVRDSALRTTEILSHALLGKKQIVLPKDKTFSAVYEGDLCKIMAWLLTHSHEKGIYNAAAPQAVTLSDFAKKAKAYAKKDERELTVTVGQESECECTLCADKLIAALGGFKFTSLGSGINKTLDYYKSHKSQLRDIIDA